MKKRFSEEQIVKILGEHQTGKKVKEIARASVKTLSTTGNENMAT